MDLLAIFVHRHNGGYSHSADARRPVRAVDPGTAARFEYHPNNPAASTVLLGRVSADLLDRRLW